MQKKLTPVFVGALSIILAACEQPDSETPSDHTAVKPAIAITTETNAEITAKTQTSTNPTTEIPEAIETPLTSEANPASLPESAFKTVEWTELMPQEDLDALLNPPSYVTDVEDGSEEDIISGQLQSAIAAASDDRYQQALASTEIIAEMDNQAIRIAGFIVPLEFDDDQTITQFFLVPFFGACIHVPPPPPNQIIFVDYPKGLKVEALYDPFWISGVLKTSVVQNDVATSAYSMEAQTYEIYTEG